MKSTLKSLKTELTDFDKVKKNYENCLAHIKVQCPVCGHMYSCVLEVTFMHMFVTRSSLSLWKNKPGRSLKNSTASCVRRRRTG